MKNEPPIKWYALSKNFLHCFIAFDFAMFQTTRHLFMAAERKIPKIRIETRQAESLMGCRIIVSIDSWPRTSRYPLVTYSLKTTYQYEGDFMTHLAVTDVTINFVAQ